MIKVHDIARAVARATGLTLDDLKGRSREKPINDARQLVMWLARQITTASYPAIGRALGGRDHRAPDLLGHAVGDVHAAPALAASLTAPRHGWRSRTRCRRSAGNLAACLRHDVTATARAPA